MFRKKPERLSWTVLPQSSAVPMRIPAKTFGLFVAAALIGVGLISFVGMVTTKSVVYGATSELRLYMKSSSTSVTADDTFSVQIRLANTLSSRVDYASARVQFSPSVLQVTSVSKTGSAFTQNSGPAVSFNNSTGSISFTGRSANYLQSPSDTLVATITFRAKSSGASTLRYLTGAEVGETIGASGKIKNYLTSTTGTTISVAAKPVVQQPAPSATPAPTTIPGQPQSKPVSPQKTTKPSQAAPEEKGDEEQTAAPLPTTDDLGEPALEPVEPVASEVEGATASTSTLGKLPLVVAGVVGLLAVPVVAALIRNKRYSTRKVMQNPFVSPHSNPLTSSTIIGGRYVKYTLALGGVAAYAYEFIDEDYDLDSVILMDDEPNDLLLEQEALEAEDMFDKVTEHPDELEEPVEVGQEPLKQEAQVETKEPAEHDADSVEADNHEPAPSPFILTVPERPAHRV